VQVKTQSYMLDIVPTLVLI